MQKGKIARLMDKGFGFISSEESEKDLFFHAKELIDIDFDSLKEGDEVEFEVVQGEKSPQAIKVKKI
jgi:cold shock protein